MKLISDIRNEEQYNKLLRSINGCHDEQSFKKVAESFDKFNNYKNAKEMKQHCLAKAEEARKQEIYDHALSLMGKNTIKDYELAIESFKTISDYKDANEKINDCNNKIQENHLKAEEEFKNVMANRSMFYLNTIKYCKKCNQTYSGNGKLCSECGNKVVDTKISVEQWRSLCNASKEKIKEFFKNNR